MRAAEKISGISSVKKITTARIVCALAMAVAADVLQFLLLPFAWTFVDSAIDVAAMFLIMWLIGFHWLLLPTFVIEFVPVIDAFPTWTACTAAVIALRRHDHKVVPKTSASPNKPVIGV